MKITIDKLREITFGCLEIKEESDGIHFYRFTKKQLDAFFEWGNFYGSGAISTAGVVMDFYTDSKELVLSVSGGNKYEVMVDGLNFSLVHFDEMKEKKAIFSINPSGKRVRVTLALPSHSQGVVNSVELDDGAEITPYKYSQKLLFIGDSIVQGWDAVHDTLSHAYRTARFFDAELLNHGVGGTCFNHKCFDFYDFDPDRIIIGFGTNDFHGRSSFEKLVSETVLFFEKFKERYPQKPVYAITPIWRADNGERPAGTFDACRKAIAEIAERFGCVVIDGFEIFPHVPEYLADGFLHPNDLGFGIYAENLIKSILKHENRI